MPEGAAGREPGGSLGGCRWYPGGGTAISRAWFGACRAVGGGRLRANSPKDGGVVSVGRCAGQS